MGFSRFSLLLIVRLLCIMAAISVTGLLIFTPGYHAGTLLAVIVVTGLVWDVYQYISKTNQELSRFLDAARYADFGQRFEFSKLGAGFTELGDTFTHIMDRFRDDRREHESELRHLKALLEHVPVPLISVYGDGTITIWNNSARRLFGTAIPVRVDDLEQFGQEFHDRLSRVKAGDRFLVSFYVDGMEQRLTVSASEILIGSKIEKLVSLQNIQSELDGVQLTAWQDLVRVLTHEIMNSITPVASLARTAVDLVDDASRRVPNEPTVVAELEDARDAVDTVARRSEGLMSFVSSYRQLTRLPDPEKKTIRLDSLFADVSRVAAIDWQEQGISLLTHVEPEQLEVKADRKMLEQVLINLLKNAGQALVQVHSKALEQVQPQALEQAQAGTDSASVTMKGSLNRRGHVIVEVADNGPGIPEDVIDRIFVPFYTTKRDGSGVGLALSRQVMIAHGGTITFANQPGGGAKFTLIF